MHLIRDGFWGVVQKYALRSYDILFATNVLHATRDMETTIQNCKALLRKGGLLIANELTTKTEFLTLTFGLTDGWWLHDDSVLRIPGSPMLSRQALEPTALHTDSSLHGHALSWQGMPGASNAQFCLLIYPM